MAVSTLSTLVTAVRAEAGHALTPSQGINAVETLKHIIRRTEYELWTAINWPQLTLRVDIGIHPGQVEYRFPANMAYEQIRHVYFLQKSSTYWHPVEFGIPEDAIMENGAPSPIQSGPTIQLWDTYINDVANEERLRVWPTPSVEGTMRLKGQKALTAMVNDDDYCTLDPTLITLFASAELLQRAKAEDAQGKMQKAQRHLTKLLAARVSDKQKISTFGASRGPRAAWHRMRPGIEYIP